MASTSVYALPYQALTDSPHGPNLGEDLAEAVEAELQRIDTQLAALSAENIGTYYKLTGTLLTSSGVEVALASWDAGSSGPAIMRNGHVYEVQLIGGMYDSNSTVHVATLRVRKGVNTVAGLELVFWRGQTVPGVGSLAVPNLPTFVGYIKNVSGADVTFTPGLTIQRTLGTANVSLFGDVNIVCAVTLTDKGLVSDQQQLAAIARTIT